MGEPRHRNRVRRCRSTRHFRVVGRRHRRRHHAADRHAHNGLVPDRVGLEAQGILKHQRHRVDAAIDLVGLSTFRNAYPHQLSGGMAQRVALARALVNDPKILILDEPLGKLDSLTRISMQAEIASLWQRSGFTTLLVTHDVEEAVFLANRVIVFSDRPARIKADIAVDRPYPRHRGDPKLAELRRNILGLLGLDATW